MPPYVITEHMTEKCGIWKFIKDRIVLQYKIAKTQASTHLTVCVLKFIFNIYSLLLHGTSKTSYILSVLCGKVHRLGFSLEKGDISALKLHWSVVDEILTHYLSIYTVNIIIFKMLHFESSCKKICRVSAKCNIIIWLFELTLLLQVLQYSSVFLIPSTMTQQLHAYELQGLSTRQKPSTIQCIFQWQIPGKYPFLEALNATV